MNRPAKRNALSIELRERLMEELAALAHDDDVRCAVLTGAGTAFCSGMDRDEFGGERAHRERLVEVSVGAFAAVGTFPKPLLGALNGPAVAGGFALALLCDLRLAAPAASMGFPEAARLGIPPAFAAARAALPAPLARELCLTGASLSAEEALRRGVVAEVVPGVVDRAVAAGIAAQLAFVSGATKRRILVEREAVWAPFFAEEERALREALWR
ncbi:MAG TPA: enoyl-CoA hydratase/isomerase family protein [Solirubrobacteraceae bacterium]|nr:enoyl-CoA hydratase/isomerase family protein [Solirubrobacteraceae bacterium]